MNPVYTPIDRTEVLACLGPAWPPKPADPCLAIPADTGMTDGAATVYPIEGQPGTSWWVVDSTIYRQDAGTPDEVLAAMLPGSVLGAVPSPDPAPDTPPQS